MPGMESSKTSDWGPVAEFSKPTRDPIIKQEDVDESKIICDPIIKQEPLDESKTTCDPIIKQEPEDESKPTCDPIIKKDPATESSKTTYDRIIKQEPVTESSKTTYDRIIKQESVTSEHKDNIVPFPGSIRYDRFPAKIRRKILKLALTPGHVYIGTHSKDSKEPRLGVQILATCQKAYEQGHRTYYTKNIFHPPRGPVDTSKKFFGLYRRKHRRMIRHMAVTLTLNDLCTKHVKNHVEMMAYDSVCRTFPADEIQHYSFWTAQYARHAAAVLHDIWAKKVRYIRHKFRNLKDLRVKVLIKHDSELIKELPVRERAKYIKTSEIFIRRKWYKHMFPYRYEDMVDSRPTSADKYMMEILKERLEKAQSWAETAIKDNLNFVMRKQEEDGKQGSGLDRDILGYDWCTALMLENRQRGLWLPRSFSATKHLEMLKKRKN